MGPFSTNAFSISLQEENESIESSALDTFGHPFLFIVLYAARSREIGLTETSTTALCSTPTVVVQEHHG
jgi:hypothetical protein